VSDDIVVDIRSSDDIVAARQAGHHLAREHGFSLTDVTMIATAISEVARNITSYAGSGEVRVMVADREGLVVAFALGNLQERAQMFVTPGDHVYEGMIAGESSRPGDMDVNVTKEKKLTNMRTTASDDNVILEPPRQITLEYALEYIEEDELIEVTPKTIRLRKRVLTANDRKKAARAARVADAS